MGTAVTTDATYRAVSVHIAAARESLIALAKTRDDWWHPYELKTQAQNGAPAGAVSLAFNELVDDGTLEVAPQGVRLRAT